ncbi:uroporphyrinogen-III synthase [Granulicella cerasi]|uniref:Uroporphyrinogen-III synthase n=1 Tax=Granulicella cerasi TaxID=741063 RepID=A0ABW1ZDJ5_9BACT|nr:uroporphyrinogen-III synthase [Granulicella cerasi]
MPTSPRILVTRALHQASALEAELRALGAEPVVIPSIEIVAPESFAALDNAFMAISMFDWLLFTSANAVEAALGRGLYERWSTARRRPRVAAIGNATARQLVAAGLSVELLPEKAVAESFAEVLLANSQAGQRFLLIRAAEAREVLPDALTAAGRDVVIAPAYRNVIPHESADALRALFATAPPDAITFTSSSAVSHLLALFEAAGIALPENVRRVSIGPVTSATLAEAGYPAHAEAREATVRALAEACMS